jgi:hypothetical protein
MFEYNKVGFTAINKKVTFMIDNDMTRNVAHTVYVISGSMGKGGEQLSRKVLSQFQNTDFDIVIASYVSQPEQIEDVVNKAAKTKGTLVNTLVNRDLNSLLHDLANEKNVHVIDLVTDFLNHLSGLLDMKPVGKPGLYRRLHADYFKRVEAIEYTLAHDDGMNYDDWQGAEIVLTGVSRVGKTPLSIYLSTLGWKVANIPIVPGVEPREEMFELDRARVFGLTIDPSRLLNYRQERQQRLGISRQSDYHNLTKLYEEVDAARKVFRRGRFQSFDVTNMAIEASADKIVSLIKRRG